MVTDNESGHFLKSDDLAMLREFLATARLLGDTFENAIQLRVILDSNAIVSDLIWLSKKRIKPEARTSIQELVASQTLIPYAPSVAKLEIEKHIADVALKKGIPEEQLRNVWANYQKSVHFCDVEIETQEDNARVRDPNDLPFIRLEEQIGASGIVTNDKDIAAMGGNRINFDCIIQLRDYSRAKHLELTFGVGGMFLAAISVGAILGLVKILQSLIQAIARLPPWIQIMLVAGVVFVVAHPKTRKVVGDYVKSLGAKIQDGVLNLKEPFNEALNKVTKAQESANASLIRVQEIVQGDKRVPLRVHVYALCLASNIPLSIAQIERKVFAAGYKTRSEKFKSYLLSILKKDDRLGCTADGRWSIIRNQSEVAGHDVLLKEIRDEDIRQALQYAALLTREETYPLKDAHG